MKNIILLALLFVMFMGVVYGAMVATGGQHSDMTGTIVGISEFYLIFSLKHFLAGCHWLILLVPILSYN